MAIVREMLRNALPLLNRSDEFDVRIHETHHELKVDSPSGTALTLADLLLSGLDGKTTIRSTPARDRATMIAGPDGPTTIANPVGLTTIADANDQTTIARPHGPITFDVTGNGGCVDSSDPATTIEISSDRIGSIIGRHAIEFSGLFDSITLTHDAVSRDGFAAGAILAAEWLIGRRGIYTFDDVFISKPIQKIPETRPSSPVSHRHAFGV
jgi:4-hydroxy-tetrahydrodipicolinate reductase